MFCSRHWAAVFAAALLTPSLVLAASVDLSPVRLELNAQGQPVALRLTNTGAAELSMQVTALEWAQDSDGADQLTETAEILAVPPMFSIPPGGRQIVRIGFLGTQDPELERSFRLLISELQPAAVDDAGGSKLVMRMNFSVPAFVAPAAPSPYSDLVLNSVEDFDGATVLRLENAGNVHARLTNFDVLGLDGWRPISERIPVRYLLPGRSARIRLPADLGPLSAIRISAADGRDWEYAVPPRP